MRWDNLLKMQQKFYGLLNREFGSIAIIMLWSFQILPVLWDM